MPGTAGRQVPSGLDMSENTRPRGATRRRRRAPKPAVEHQPAPAPVTATLTLDDRSFAYWFPGDGLPPDTRDKLRMPLAQIAPDDKQPRWRVDSGRYRLHIGRSSANIDETIEIEVRSTAQP